VRGRRLHRLLKVIKLLRGPTAWNARKLADHFGTTRRNIYRDLAILELAGIPYYFDSDFGEGGGYRIKSEWWFPNVGLTEQECLDLAVLTKVAETRAIPLVDQVCEVRDKLLATLPAKQQELIVEASDLFDVLSLHMADHSKCRGTMATVQAALIQKKQVEGTYYTPHKKQAEKVRLQPQRVMLAGQSWYLAAHCCKAGETRLYRLPRFRTLKLVEEPITVPPGCSLRELLGNAWGVYRGDREHHVEILFDSEAAELISEVRWHTTQELVPQKDGSLIFRATVSGLEEIRWWVLGWGPRAKVLKPKELKEEIRSLIQRTMLNYEGPERTTTQGKRSRK
jgi:predicted DNA-binding transcriptional regulator YafY